MKVLKVIKATVLSGGAGLMKGLVLTMKKVPVIKNNGGPEMSVLVIVLFIFLILGIGFIRPNKTFGFTAMHLCGKNQDMPKGMVKCPQEDPFFESKWANLRAGMTVIEVYKTLEHRGIDPIMIEDADRFEYGLGTYKLIFENGRLDDWTPKIERK